MKQETGFDSAVFEAGAAIDDARNLLRIVLDSFVSSSEWTPKDNTMEAAAVAFDCLKDKAPQYETLLYVVLDKLAAAGATLEKIDHGDHRTDREEV